MDSFLIFWLFAILLASLILVGLIYFSYWLPKKLGYRKVGTWLSRSLIVAVFALILSFIFEDVLFFESDAKKMLKEHQIELKDDFKIVSNKTSGIGDFCHRFELTISPHDKQELLNRIITAPTFKESVPEDFNIRTGKPRYANHDTSFTAYYQSKLSYVYEFYQPNKQGYKPTWNRISISRIENKLAYELIQD